MDSVQKWIFPTYAILDCGQNLPRAAPTKKLTEEHYRIIDNALAENDELITIHLRELLVEK